MAFVIYHKETTKLLKASTTADNRFVTERAAKAALTRAVKASPYDADTGRGVRREDYEIADANYFFLRIERKEIRHGVGPAHGKEFECGVNDSWTSGPWSESYWSS